MEPYDMKRFHTGQRVVVRAAVAAVGDGAGNRIETASLLGTVVRVRRGDNGAWVRLDERGPEELHAFPVDDSRALHVLTYPDWGELDPKVSAKPASPLAATKPSRIEW